MYSFKTGLPINTLLYWIICLYVIVGVTYSLKYFFFMNIYWLFHCYNTYSVTNISSSRPVQRWLFEPNQMSNQLSRFKFEPNQRSSQMLGLTSLPNQSLNQIVLKKFRVQLLGQIFTLWAKNELKVLTF